MRSSTTLLGLTLILLILGSVLYATGFIGWAQCSWVLASGTAGAGVMAWLDEHPGSDG